MAENEVAEIARKLTKAQRYSLSTFRPDWCCFWNIQAALAAERKGLGTRYPNANCLKLTPLGLAVRTYLQGNSDA
jgi:hypothetical protein